MKIIFALLLLNFFSIVVVYSYNEEEKKEIITTINEIRSVTEPPGANIREVEWDDCYEKIALNYLEGCPSDVEAKNPNAQIQATEAGCEASESVGETLSYCAPEDTCNPFGNWFSERAHYDLDSKTCSAECDNYLQLVNAETYLVGCASHDQTPCGRTGTVYLCTYSTAPNKINGPYNEGQRCSECDGEFLNCKNRLCSRDPTATPIPTKVPTTNSVPSFKTPHNHHHGHKHENNDKEHDHKHGQNSHDHKHGKNSHDHAHNHDHSNNNGDEKAMISRFEFQVSDATSNRIMVLLFIASIFAVLLFSL